MPTQSNVVFPVAGRSHAWRLQIGVWDLGHHFEQNPYRKYTKKSDVGSDGVCQCVFTDDRQNGKAHKLRTYPAGPCVPGAPELHAFSHRPSAAELITSPKRHLPSTPAGLRIQQFCNLFPGQQIPDKHLPRIFKNTKMHSETQ